MYALQKGLENLEKNFYRCSHYDKNARLARKSTRLKFAKLTQLGVGDEKVADVIPEPMRFSKYKDHENAFVVSNIKESRDKNAVRSSVIKLDLRTSVVRKHIKPGRFVCH